MSTDDARSGRVSRAPQAIAVIGGIVFSALGLWALIAPSSFFDTLARFEPYNQHFLQDIGAFQIGLGMVLLLATVPAYIDGLAAALFGVGIGSALHTASHVVGVDLGGNPAIDIPSLAVITIALLAGGWLRQRQRPPTQPL
jgi:hypothetical protein